MTQKQFKTLHIAERVGEKVQRNTSDKFNANDRIINNLKSKTSPEAITETITTGNSSNIASLSFTPRGNPVEVYFIPGTSARFQTGSDCTLELYRDEVLVSSVNLNTAMRRPIKDLSLVDPQPPGKLVSYVFKVVATTGNVTLKNIYALIREL